MESQKVQNIIVFKQRNIGDVLMITPVLRALKERFPGANIVVVVNVGTEGALENNSDVAEVQVYDRGKFSGLRQALYEVAFLCRLRKRRFDLSISFTEGDRSMWYSLFCGAKQRWGWVNPKVSPFDLRFKIYHVPVLMNAYQGHEVNKHYHLLQQAGLGLPIYPLRFVPPPAALAWAQQEWTKATGTGFRVHIHPVSRWLWKAWEPGKMAQVIDWLYKERGAQVVLTTGPNAREAAAAREIVRMCRHQPHFIEGTCSLAQLGALTQAAHLFLGVDTGPMHFAAAVGTPVVALFGPTSPRSWGPWKVPAVILQRPCACNLAGDRERCDWSKVRECLAAITVEEVCAAVDQLSQTVQ